MPLKFVPKSEEEIKKNSSQFESLPPGDYPFTVLESKEEISKSEKNNGKTMCAVKLNVHGPHYDRFVFDRFSDWLAEHKMKHFLEAVGLGEKYVSGNIDATNNAWEGRTGWVKIKIRKDDSKFNGQNEVVDYIVKNKEAAPATTPKPPEDDSVPF